MADREIVLDTETTGINPNDGHRIVEIGAVELINTVPTGRTYHQYINPRMAMPADAFAIHGISDADLEDKPFFEDIAGAFLDFIGDAALVIHNATFDIPFLDHELARAGFPQLGLARSVDTLAMARQKFPGAQNNLDALCRRFGIDNSKRVKHGALLDSEILAEVYLEMIGGRQSALLLTPERNGGANGARSGFQSARVRPTPLAPRLSDAEREAHAAFVATLGDAPLWKQG